jgi:hypothetical protein
VELLEGSPVFAMPPSVTSFLFPAQIPHIAMWRQVNLSTRFTRGLPIPIISLKYLFFLRLVMSASYLHGPEPRGGAWCR